MNTVFRVAPPTRRALASLLVSLLLLSGLSACGGGGGGSGQPVPREPVDLDRDADGFVDSVDIDDDGDGLIEIGTLLELNGIRRNLAGTAWIDEQDIETTTGCPASGCFGYELTADIDFAAGEDFNWLPIGHTRAAAPFSAHFDGNGFALRNLQIDRTRSDSEFTSGIALGLFGRVQGTAERPVEIRNLSLSGSVKGAGEIGMLMGTAEHVQVQNVVVTGEVTLLGGASLIDSAFLGGGIAGSLKFARIEQIQFAGSVTVENARQPGSEQPGTALDVGGLCGVMRNSVMVASVFNGDVRARGLRSGGFAGSVLSESQIATSVAFGSVQGDETVGGIAGATTDSSVSDVLVSMAVQGMNQWGGSVGDDRRNDYRGLLLTVAFPADVIVERGGLIAGRSQDSHYAATYALASPYVLSQFGQLQSSVEQSADQLQAWSLAQLQCAERADTGQCEGAASYAGFSAVWDFGNPEQLPGLFISDQLYRDNDLDQRKDS